ncbi:hypothetical protein [Roseivirga spongicola]|nr:hypothetical protein [Roseivirga spongicola]WPZ08718.1 hypothetical protein T7867_10660 [Roseivirga spongicola]
MKTRKIQKTFKPNEVLHDEFNEFISMSLHGNYTEVYSGDYPIPDQMFKNKVRVTIEIFEAENKIG